ncbi:F-box domain-containing protein [Mycena chlorophos]|uniref:F-box domain-containing protein n=1 Tax=Mycena chlorophos TaxID=658473 RepID=A0A8H6TNW6_MYCCL|nr:F-box domain-containing protein [Mycena chlorophos]
MSDAETASLLEESHEAYISAAADAEHALQQSPHPILALPSEIISEIFIHYLPPYPHCPPLLGDASPTKLTQICGRWREIAHHTPALWRAVELFMVLRDAASLDLQLETARTWLERSCGLPLCVILGNAMSRTDVERHARNALRLLLDHHTRWEYAALHVSVATWIPGQAAERDMPLLREFDLKYMDTSFENNVEGTLNAPLLSTAFLDCDFARTKRVPLLLAWNQITRLRLRHSNLGVTVAILRDAANLVECSISLTTIGDLDLAPGDVLKFERLETLSITAGFSNCQKVDRLLSAFCAPNLRRFHVDCDMLDYRRGNNAASFPAILAAMGCRLEYLSLANTKQSVDEFREVLPDIKFIHYRPRLSDEWGIWDLRAL